MAKSKQQNLWNTLIGFAGAGLGFVNQVVLMGRLFSTEELGLTRILFQAATLYAQFIVFGGNNLTIRFFPGLRNQKLGNARLFQAGFVILLVGLFSSSILLYLFEDSLLGVYASRSELFVQYAIWTLPMAFGFAIFQWLGSWTHVLQKSVFESRLKEVWLRLLITLAISLYAFGGIDWDLFVSGYSFIPLIVCIPLIVFAYRHDLFQKIQPVSFKEFREFLNFSFYNVLSRASGFITLTIDVLIIGSLVGLTGVAVYSIGTYIVSFVVIPSRALQKVAFPKIAHYWAEKDLESIQRLYRNTSVGLFFWSGSLFVGGYFFAPVLISYLGSEYELILPVFLAFGLGRMVEMITSINRGILRNSAIFKYETLFTLLFATSMIVCDLMFIPIWGKEAAIEGIVGAAWGSALSITIFNTLVSGLLFRKYNLSPFSKKHVYLIAWFGMWVFLLTPLEAFSIEWKNALLRAILFGVSTLILFAILHKKSDNRAWLSLSD